MIQYPQLTVSSFKKETRYLDGQIWTLKANSLTSQITVTVTANCQFPVYVAAEIRDSG